METVFDWVTMGIFAGLIVLFLQRSTAEVQVDKVTDYLLPALCCAVANYVGNRDHPILATMIIATIPIYVWLILKPFAR